MSNPPPRFITPEGFARIRAEYDELFSAERPKLVETIAWAAAAGSGEPSSGQRDDTSGRIEEHQEHGLDRALGTVVGQPQVPAQQLRGLVVKVRGGDGILGPAHGSLRG